MCGPASFPLIWTRLLVVNGEDGRKERDRSLTGKEGVTFFDCLCIWCNCPCRRTVAPFRKNECQSAVLGSSFFWLSSMPLLSDSFSSLSTMPDAPSSASLLHPRHDLDPSKSWKHRLKTAGSVVVHHARKHVGVGIVCAVAYFDP